MEGGSSDVGRPRRDRSQWSIAAVACVAAIVVVAFAAIDLQRERDSVEAQTEIESRALSTIIATHVQDTLLSARTLLGSFVTQVQTTQQGNGFNPAELQHDAQLLLAGQHQFAGLILLDAAGRFIVSSPLSAGSGTDLSQLRGYRDIASTKGDPNRVVIGSVIKGGLSSRWFVPMSRGIYDASGQLTGVAILAINPSSFVELFQALSDDRYSAVTVQQLDDGVIAARSPDQDAFIGRSLASGKLFHDLLPRAPEGFARLSGVLYGRAIFTYYRTVPNTPFFVNVAFDENEVLAPWHALAYSYAALCCAFLVVVAICALLAQRYRTRQIELAAATQSREIIGGMSPYVALTNADGVVLEANRSLLEVGDLGRQDVVGHPLAETCWFADQREQQVQVRTLIGQAQPGRPLRADLQFRVGDARFIVVDTTFEVIGGAFGLERKIVVSGVEVTERRTLEAQLRTREGDLQAIMTHAPIAIFLKDGEGRYRHVNRYYEQLYDLTKEQLIGHTSAECFTPDQARRNRVSDEEVLTKGSIYWREVSADPSRDGIEHMLINKFPIRDEHGRINGLAGFTIDITARKRAEQELRQALNLLHDAQLLGRTGYLHLDIARNRVVWSDSLFELRKVPRRDFFTIEESESFVHPEDQRRIRERRQMPNPFEDFEMDLRVIRGDGSLAWERAIRHHQLGENGNLVGLLVVVADITKRKQDEATLARTRENMARAQHAAGLGSFERELPSGTVVWSDEMYRIHGLAKGTHLSFETALNQVHPADRARVIAARAANLNGEQPENIEFRITRPDGSERLIRREAYLLRDGETGVTRYFGIHQDITERRALEAQLFQSQKLEAIGQLTGGLAHDFNNLLAVIIGNLDFARPLVSTQPEVDELLEDALQSALHGAELITRLLAFARRQPLHAKPLILNELIAGMFKLLSRVLGGDIEVSLELGSNVWPVISDEAQLSACLANLATNARDAMPQGGQLIIATGNWTLDADYAATHSEVTPGDYAMIKITDTGTGMAPAVLSHIFEPFFTTKEAGKGTGLGLSMVFGFMKQSGGHVSVYSEPGIGTTFHLYLPRATQRDDEIETAAIALPRPGGGETVLAVDDNEDLRLIVTRQLHQLGYHVLAADGPTTALALMETEVVDLLLTDIVMPGKIDGLMLAELFRGRHPDIKVVFTSGFPETKFKEHQMAEIAAARFLSKPYRREELAQVLREALEA